MLSISAPKKTVKSTNVQTPFPSSSVVEQLTVKYPHLSAKLPLSWFRAKTYESAAVMIPPFPRSSGFKQQPLGFILKPG